jgi:polar amino acid transport system substrate-binding protein
MSTAISPELVRELAPTGVLRAGINLSNFLLVTGKAPNGDPTGIAPDMARAVADRLGVGVTYATYKTPGELADMAEQDAWDIGLIGAEPKRAATIAFSPAYVEIEASYIVPAGSTVQSMADVDRPGVRIAVTGNTAYGNWLDLNIKLATLVRSATLDSATEQFKRDGLDVLAGLKPKLLSDLVSLPGARILEGKFTAVQQAIGTPRKNTAGAVFLNHFVEQAKASGFVAELIKRHSVVGLAVAPPVQ